MLRVLVILLRRQRGRFRDVDRGAGDGGTVDIRRLGIGGVGLDALGEGCGGVEGSLPNGRLEWGAPAESSGLGLRGGGGSGPEGGLGGGAIPLQKSGACAGDHCVGCIGNVLTMCRD